MEDCPYCHGDKAVAKIAQAMGFRPDIAFVRIRKLEQAMQEFVDRCERGEIRSKYTYSKFKELLTNK